MHSFSIKQTVDRNSPIPLYKQIKAILIEELQTSRNQYGKPFSTEEELVRRFNISRAPIRQALKELTDEGYVYRERAKGTFPVQGAPIRPPSLELGGLVGYLRENGMDCNSKILVVERVIPNEKITSILQMKSLSQVLKIARLILLKGEPLILTQTYLNVTEQFMPDAKTLEQAESVFALLENNQGVYIFKGEHQVYAASATEEEATQLNLVAGDPVLVMETKLYSRDFQLIGWRRAVHKANDYKLSFTVNR